MSQFNYLNEINNALTMDGDLNRCPAPRWQKKAGDASSTSLMNGSKNTSKLSMSYNMSALSTSISNMTNKKTPQKHGGTTKTKKTPNGRNGPSSSPNKNLPTAGGDRFIPHRGSTNYEIGHYLIKQEQPHNSADDQQASGGSNSTNIANNNVANENHQHLLSEALQLGDVKNRRLFSFKAKAPAAPDFHQNPLRVVYSVTKTPLAQRGNTRHIPSSPERILDAPDIINDYYLNLMDWSSDNIVTVALGQIVYLWNAATGTIEQLREYDNNGEHACSLSWIQDGQILAIGNSTGAVELWDCDQMKRLRVMDGHTGRVGALAWNSFTVSSGSRDGTIVHHDVRQRDHAVAELRGHTQEVCGLKWSPDQRLLASGGNDNLVHVWSGPNGNNAIVHQFNEHQAAVRALAWCPWQTNVLATGGGTADRCIKFWNVNNGTLLNSVDTQSQVCALLWSKTYKELISAHGYANNQLTIWRYPSMVKQAELTGHTSRVLQIAMSPDGSTVMSAAADETLRLWNCFAPDAAALAKKKLTAGSGRPSALKQSIR